MYTYTHYAFHCVLTSTQLESCIYIIKVSNKVCFSVSFVGRS